MTPSPVFFLVSGREEYEHAIDVWIGCDPVEAVRVACALVERGAFYGQLLDVVEIAEFDPTPRRVFQRYRVAKRLGRSGRTLDATITWGTWRTVADPSLQLNDADLVTQLCNGIPRDEVLVTAAERLLTKSREAPSDNPAEIT